MYVPIVLLCGPGSVGLFTLPVTHVSVNRFFEQYHVWICCHNSSYLYFSRSCFDNSEFLVLQRKLILKYSHKYRLGLWKPRADAIKA